MGDSRYRARAFTLIELVTVLAILAVITTTAAVALGKMFSLTRQVRLRAVSDQQVRTVLLDLSGELHSAGTVRCHDGRAESAGGGQMPADTLFYEYNGRPGEPFKPGSLCTIRLVSSDDPHVPSALVKEVRSELEGQGTSTESRKLVENAVGFDIKCLGPKGRWRSQADGDVRAVSITVWTAGSQRGRDPRAYSTAVNVPRSIWKGGTPM